MKRIFATYIITFMVVATILTLIGKCPWGETPIIAIKRVVLVVLPASMSAVVTDVIK